MLDKELLKFFLEDIKEVCREWEYACIALQECDAEESVQALFRAIHTIKGNVSTLPPANAFLLFIHDLETQLESLTSSESKLLQGDVLQLLEIESEVLKVFDRWDGATEVYPSEAMLACLKNLSTRVTPKNVADEKKEVADLTTAKYPPKTQRQVPERTPRPGIDKSESKSVHYNSSLEEVDLSIKAKSLTRLLDLLQETMIHHEILENFIEGQVLRDSPILDSVRIVKRSAEQVKRSLIEVRSVDLSSVFNRLKRTAIETGIKLEKPIHFRVKGTHIRIDREIVNKLMTPLIHLVRNAADHGIEDKQTRESLGKPAAGTIELEAIQFPHSIEIHIRDDGGGIDYKNIMRKAKERKILRTEKSHKIETLREIMFHPGFSTKQKSDSVSGRGVGLDVVRDSIRNLGGEVSIQERPESGTQFVLKIPSKATLTKVVVCEVGSKTVAFPLSEIEIIKLRPEEADFHNPGRLNYQGNIIPIEEVADLLNEHPLVPERLKPLVICKTATGLAGGLVDKVIGQRKVGIKKIASEIQDFDSFLGWAFYDEGKPISVLSISGMLMGSVHTIDQLKLESDYAEA